MSSKNNSPISTTLNALYVLCSLIFVAAVAHHHVQLIQYPLPLSYIEPAISAVTDYIASGKNPYALESQPSRTSVYPVLYNIMAAPLSDAFGNTLTMHRALSAAFLAFCCALFYSITYRFSQSHSDTLAVTAILYCGFMVYSTPIASPNGIGLVLFFAALFLPTLANFSMRSLALSITLGVLAFHSKQYFISALGFMALYLFLARGKRLGFYFGLLSFAAFMVSLAAILPGSPYYLDSLVFAVSAASQLGGNNAFMWQQWAEYLPVIWPVLTIIGAALIRYFTANKLASVKKGPQAWPTARFTQWKAPLLSHELNPVWVFLACSVFIFSFSLGRNPGNHLTYLFQIVAPFVLIIAATATAKASWQRWPMRLLLLIAFATHYSVLSHDFSVQEEDNWTEIKDRIGQADSIYATTFALEHLVQQGADIHNNGHTNYFQIAKYKPSFLKRTAAGESVEELWQLWSQDIHSRISAQTFDLVVIDTWTPLPNLHLEDNSKANGNELLAKYYKKIKQIKIKLANRPGGGSYSVQIWEPNHER
ncbi:MAG: hypothetical protein AB8C02_14690 [Halioglobus sp.]